MSLTEEQQERYLRHIALDNVGISGQEKLLSGKVLIVGVGGLGSPVALYLAAAGVGTLGIIDADVVDLSNLQRQVIHSTNDLNRPKVESARDKLEALNPDVTINSYYQRLEAENAVDIISEYDFVIDATDNFPSKFLIADACHFANKPYAHAGILRFDGQIITVLPGQSTCYRCIFQDTPDTKEAKPGLFGVLPGIIGNLQATEAIKYILGVGELLTDRLLTYNALDMTFREIKISRNKDCPLCGESPSITSL